MANKNAKKKQVKQVVKFGNKKWRLFNRIVDPRQEYIVGRIIDETKPPKADNVEYAQMEYTMDKEAAERIRDELNGKSPKEKQDEETEE